MVASLNRWPRAVSQTKVNHLGRRLAVVPRDQHVRGLDVTVDDALLMRVLDGLAHRNEQLDPLPQGQALGVAVLSDRCSVNQLHYEVGPASGSGAGVEYAGNVCVIHDRQRLALALEARDHLFAVHTRLDYLEGNVTANGLDLLRVIDNAHGVFPELPD
jgi:hypothetical protein